MKYLSICNTKRNTSKKAKVKDIAEWDRISKNEKLHKKCKMIKCFETGTVSPQKLIFLIDTDEPDALNMLARDLGKDWNLETYSIHEMHEVTEEDHSVIAG